MEFEIIANEFSFDEYRYVFDGSNPVGFGYNDTYAKRVGQNRLDSDIDSLYDTLCGPLCRGEDGELYGTVLGLVGDHIVPVVWQRVEKIR